MPRDLLANLLAGHAVDLSGATAEEINALLEQARSEGAVALAHRALAAPGHVAHPVLEVFAAAARAEAAAGLARQAECRRVCRTLAAAGLRPLVLKGLAVGAWLYPQAYLRESSDIDLLFASRADAERAAAVLEPLGYAVPYRPGGLAQEFLCRGSLGQMSIDLDMHWRISAMPLFSSTFSFVELQQASIPLPSLGPDARGLGPAHACLHACMHRASNLGAGMGDRLKWLYDLHLMALHFSDEDWETLLRLCRERGLCGVCAEGFDAADPTFGTPLRSDVRQALAEGRTGEALDAGRLGDWNYMQRQNLRALPSLVMRAHWLWQRLFPPADYLRELYGTEQGHATLLMERCRRAWQRLTS